MIYTRQPTQQLSTTKLYLYDCAYHGKGEGEGEKEEELYNYEVSLHFDIVTSERK